MRTSSKKFCLIMVAMLALIVSACAAPTGAPAPAEGGVTMSFWTRDSNQAQVRQLVDAWNESHENQIEITVIPASEYITKVGAASAAGTPPDIIAVDLIYVPQFAAASQLTDISDKANASPVLRPVEPVPCASGDL